MSGGSYSNTNRIIILEDIVNFKDKDSGYIITKIDEIYGKDNIYDLGFKHSSEKYLVGGFNFVPLFDGNKLIMDEIFREGKELIRKNLKASKQGVNGFYSVIVKDPKNNLYNIQTNEDSEVIRSCFVINKKDFALQLKICQKELNNNIKKKEEYLKNFMSGKKPLGV